MPGERMEQVEEVKRVLSGTVTAPLNASTLQLVSDGLSPDPTKLTVDSSCAAAGESVRVGAPALTLSTA